MNHALRENLERFLAQPARHRLSLMGMSGVGKTTLCRLLDAEQWFVYSVDYRIGTRYLNEALDDFLLQQVLQLPSLKKMFATDAFTISAKVTQDNLSALSAYLGMVGSREANGLSQAEFLKRLSLHRHAEIAATIDVPTFIDKGLALYGKPHFICDTSGSICELADEKTWALLSQETLLIYLKAPKTMEAALIQRAIDYPKPLYYQEEFLINCLEQYLQQQNLEHVEEVQPTDFVRWVFPKLIEHRLPLYESIAERHGITLAADAVMEIKTQEAFLALVTDTVRQRLEEV